MFPLKDDTMNTEKAELFIQKYDMLPPGTRVLCAVSGGADSVALLHFLHEREGAEVIAAHFNHCLRGEESDRDEEFVKALCESLGVKCVTERGDVAAFAAESGRGTEDAARVLRYEFLRRTAESEGCGRIATAHNADDNAETVLLNLTRGTGLKGLGGIPPVRGEIIRPLLQTTRAEIEDYLSDKGLGHIEDSSNALDDYSRNRLRHHVTPILREVNPAFAETVARMTESLREDEEYFREKALEFIAENCGDDGSVPAAELMALPRSVRMRVIRIKCGREIAAVHCRAVENLCLVRSLHAHADIPGMRVTREFDRLIFGAGSAGEIERHILEPGTRLSLAGPGLQISCEFVPGCTEIHKSLNTFFFKSENICGRIFVASRSEGDKIRLRGRNCTKSLKKLFSEARMSINERISCPVIYDEAGVAAVYGFGVAERCAAEVGDDCLIVKIEKSKEEER